MGASGLKKEENLFSVGRASTVAALFLTVDCCLSMRMGVSSLDISKIIHLVFLFRARVWRRRKEIYVFRPFVKGFKYVAKGKFDLSEFGLAGKTWFRGIFLPSFELILNEYISNEILTSYFFQAMLLCIHHFFMSSFSIAQPSLKPRFNHASTPSPLTQSGKVRWSEGKRRGHLDLLWTG